MRVRGFTLVEMTVAITIGAIVAGFIAMFIATPVNAYFAQQRRSVLGDGAESALRHMAIDIEAALPNSVRTRTIGSLRVLEMIEVREIGLYYDGVPAGPLDLQPTVAESQFGALQPITIAAGDRIVIGNRTGPNAKNAYRATNQVITPVNVAQPVVNGNVIQLNPAFRFGNSSSGRRFYIVRSAIQYQCDLANGTLTRFANVPIAFNVVPAAAGGTLIARDVTACAFQFVAASPTPPASPTNGGIATIQMTIERVTDGVRDRMRLAQQVHVRNPP